MYYYCITCVKLNPYSSKFRGFDFIADLAGSSHIYASSEGYLSPKGLYLDIAGGKHSGGLFSFLKFVLLMASKMFRPKSIGGTNRKYELLVLDGTKMVRHSLLNITTRAHVFEMQCKELKEASKLLEEGKIKAVIDHVYAFDDVISA